MPRRQRKEEYPDDICDTCNGTGYEITRWWRLLTRQASTRLLCHTCNGSGTRTPNPPPDSIF